LREAGVVATSRRGTSIRYRLHPEAMARLAALLSSLTPADTQPGAPVR
jgi:DNA-binding transcriptional ArsR family regulator